MSRKKVTYFTSVFLLVFFCLFIAGGIVRSWQKRSWFGAEPYRVLLLHGKKGFQPTAIEILTIWPNLQTTTVLSVPPDLVTPVVGGYGNYRLAAQVELGRVEGVGDNLIRDSLGFSLGIPIHRVLWQQKQIFDVWNAQMAVLKDGLSGKQSLPEMCEAFVAFSKVRLSSQEKLSLSSENVIRLRREPDGTDSQVLERSLLERYVINHLSTMWKDAALTQISVVNASGKPQLAAQWSLYAFVGGYDVVSLTDEQTIRDQTKIIFSTQEMADSLASKALVHLFPGAQVEVGDTARYRSQAAIVLGLDSWKYLSDRQTYLRKVW